MGGRMPPPKIIMIRNAEPCVVYFPKPAIERLKMACHMIEQNNPPLKKEYIATFPTVNNPISIAVRPRRLKIKRVLAGLFLLI